MTQMEWVVDRLENAGKVTRNEAIGKGITRLSEYIRRIRKKLGWEVEGMCSGDCDDYVYVLASKNDKERNKK